MKKIVLLAFKYPPYPQVGAFRWANLSRELANNGYIVHVITTKWKLQKNSSFLDVLNNENIIIHKLPSLGFHKIRYAKSNNKLFKFFIRGFNFLLRRLLKPLYFIDEAQQWHWIMIPYVKKLIIKEKIDVLIATGAPFTVNYFAAKIKDKLNDKIKLIQDYRDPWNEDVLYVKDFSKNQLTKSKNMEKYAFNKADYNVSVTEDLCDLFKKENNKEVLLVYNGFKEIENFKDVKKRNSDDRLNIIYAGNISCGRDVTLTQLYKFLKINNLIDLIKVDIYTDKNNFLKNSKISDVVKENVEIFDKIKYSELIKKFNSYDYGLHLNAEEYSDALSTKVFDYISNNLPILSINYGGEVERFINNNCFGCSINLNFVNCNKLKLILTNREYILNKSNVEQFNYINIVKEYIKIIQR